MADGTSSCVGEPAQCHFYCSLGSNPIRSLAILSEVFLVFLSPSECYLEPLRDIQLYVVLLYQIRFHTFRTYGDMHYFVEAILLRLLRTKVHGVTYNNTVCSKMGCPIFIFQYSYAPHYDI
jgi:hypothetical protein